MNPNQAYIAYQQGQITYAQYVTICNNYGVQSNDEIESGGDGSGPIKP